MSAIQSVLEVTVSVLAGLVPLWALLAGGRAERISAVIFLIAIVSSKLVEELTSAQHAGTIFLTIDGLMALGYLTLALIFGHLWIALMMFTMAGLFAIHAFYEMAGRDLDPTFALLSNLVTIVLLASLALGVWTARRRMANGA
jgi:hypothetical protein